MAESSKTTLRDITTIAAVLATIASLFAAMSWITSGKAAGDAGDRRTAALGFMMLRLEAATEASTARVEQQTYLTQAAMYQSYAASAADENIRLILENLAITSLQMSELKGSVAENAENRAGSYLNAFDKAMEEAGFFGRVADYRSTGALIFNISAVLGSLTVILKRKEVLYVYVPVFLIGLFYLLLSLV